MYASVPITVPSVVCCEFLVRLIHAVFPADQRGSPNRHWGGSKKLTMRSVSKRGFRVDVDQKLSICSDQTLPFSVLTSLLEYAEAKVYSVSHSLLTIHQRASCF